jgi:hypothetical protein
MPKLDRGMPWKHMTTRDSISLGVCWSPTLMLFALVLPVWFWARAPQPEERLDFPTDLELFFYASFFLIWVFAMGASFAAIFFVRSFKVRHWAAGGILMNSLSFFWYPVIWNALGELRKILA